MFPHPLCALLGNMGMDLLVCPNQTEHPCSHLHTQQSVHLWGAFLVIWVWILWCDPTKMEHCCSNLHTWCGPHLYCVLVIWVWIFQCVPTKRNIAVQTCTPCVAAPLLCFGSMGMDFSACFNQTEHCCSNLHTRCSPHLYCVLVISVLR